jgi:hypothetical protein
MAPSSYGKGESSSLAFLAGDLAAFLTDFFLEAAFF